MDTKMKEYASSSAPWRRNAPWYLVLGEGAALAAVGLYALLAPGSARETVFAVFAILLAVNGAGATWSAFRQEPSKRTSFLGFRGGIGLSLGLLGLVARFTDVFDGDGARVVLAFGYLLVGIVSLAALFIARSERSFPMGTLVWNIAMIVVAILLFTGSEENGSRLSLIGWVALLLGVLLVAFGFYLKTKSDSDADAQSSPSESEKAKTAISSDSVSVEEVELVGS